MQVNWWIAFCGAAVLTVGSLGPGTVGEAEITGGVRGRVLYRGEDPDRPLPMEAQPACAALHEQEVLSERIVRDPQGGLANVLVSVEGAGLPPAEPPSAGPVVLTQKGCVYQPRVVVVRPGQELIVRNDDAMLHNVHGQPARNPRFNIGQPFQGAESKRTFTEPELGIRIRCDIHPWMIAIVHVLDHGNYQVTGPGGSFEWPQLAPGPYTVRFWHEDLGVREEQVQVEGGETVEIELVF